MFQGPCVLFQLNNKILLSYVSRQRVIFQFLTTGMFNSFYVSKLFVWSHEFHIIETIKQILISHLLWPLNLNPSSIYWVSLLKSINKVYQTINRCIVTNLVGALKKATISKPLFSFFLGDISWKPFWVDLASWLQPYVTFISFTGLSSSSPWLLFIPAYSNVFWFFFLNIVQT